MSQLDWIGGASGDPSRAFKDIRNTRSSAAEEKAQLVLELGRLCQAVPMKVHNGSVNVVRRWKAEQEKALAVAKNSRSSVVVLGLSIQTMRSFV